MIQKRQRRGYVLITTLLIVAMAGILTVGLARHSMNLAVTSIQIERDMQAKWGQLSCQRFAFDTSSRLMQRELIDRDTGELIRQIKKRTTCTVLLGEHEFRVRLDDESAKLDVNHLFTHSGSKTTRSTIRKISSTNGLTIRLSPLDSARQRKATEDSFEAWGQVFVPSNGSVSFPDGIKYASDELTCWSHRTNFQNCSDHVLIESIKPLVGSSIALKMADNRKRGIRDVEEAIRQTQASGDQQDQLERQLSNNSVSQSVWVETIGPVKTQHVLAIREVITSGISRYYSFSW